MVLVTSNKSQRLLYVCYVLRVLPAELEGARPDIEAALAELPAGFRLLVDLTQLDFMDPDCANEIGRTMDLIGQHGVGMIVRIIPNPSRDIGLNILAIFHYAKMPRVITCRNMEEALRQLLVWK